MGECLMATIPTPPTFASNDSSMDNLIALANCVTFLSDCGTRPEFHLYHKGSTVSLTSLTDKTLTLGSVAFDSDGVSDGTGATIVTQGWYDFTCCASFTPSTTSAVLQLRIEMISGASNPHFTSGTTVFIATSGGDAVDLATADTAYSFGGLSPTCLYPGDKIRLDAWMDSSGSFSVNDNVNTSFMVGRYPPTLTGYFVCPGT